MVNLSRKYFVLNPLCSNEQKEPLSFACTEVLPHVFTYSEGVSLSSTDEYKKGKILPMSYWSVIAVEMLDLQKDSSFLDMCCAPGMKLIYASLTLQRISPTIEYSVSAVDISSKRLSACISLVKKYRAYPLSIFEGDSERFQSGPILRARPETRRDACRCAIGTQSNKLFYSSTVLRKLGHYHSKEKFTRILVDPECSQTSTVKHSRRNSVLGREYHTHQLAVLRNAVSLLSNEGVLVYSTCTFSSRENEEVVQSLLKECPALRRIEIEHEVNEKYGVSSKNRLPERPGQIIEDTLFISKFQLFEA